MPCYSPIQVHSGGVKPNGKLTILFNTKQHCDSPGAFKIPCGKCIGCQLTRARQWAIRCIHESKFHPQSCFITLTYNKENLPKNGSIDPYDFQCFMKRLRKTAKTKIRYFHCGEYGKKLKRPHYHAIIFGYSFPDRKLFKSEPFRWYRSEILESLWTKGYSTICELTDASAGYVARYTLKKVYGDEAKNHYQGKHSEYITMSRMPGLGKLWYDKYKTDIYPEGTYVHNGAKIAPPKYYDRLYEKENPEDMKRIKACRMKKLNDITVADEINGVQRRVSNSDSIRLSVRERIKLSQIRHLKRIMEETE